MTAAFGPPASAIGEEAIISLRNQGARSLLALLGIVIGAASVVALLNMGHMSRLEALNRFERMGVDSLQVNTTPTGPAPAGLDRALAETLHERDAQIVRVAPLAVGRGQVHSGAGSADAMIAAVTPELHDLAGLALASGRALTALDACSQVAVIGAGLVEALSTSGAPVAPGQLLHTGGYGFTVIGVLEPIAMEALSPVDYDRAILIPLECAQRVLPGPDPTAALIRLTPGADGEAAGERVAAALANSRTAVQTRSARTLIDALNTYEAVHSRLLVSIGAISLLVGGIGVMNVMLMSVMERRREIGVRMAVGARRRDIQLMFLLESAALALCGGVLGALCGIAVSAVIAALSGWGFSVAWWTLPLGPGLAAIVGVAFGLYPAMAASRLDPIEALHAS
ncbi:ABC transporter permease [Alkalicaulis satelles]|uniref:ABC transporter permease n=1 Tax=Alkalicaulis satelles TaxID=2609175 RepID=A0A5M6ZD92_9PROT|nr:ABC transporter permease [Alkalicaulis satelles]KAA5802285.1 ABC transporter permease [Alkalicaulis satelles]